MPNTTKFVGCAASNFRGGRPAPYRPEAIVIHIMAGTLLGTDAWFANPASVVSAHYGVGKNGEIHQYVREEDTAFHAGRVTAPSWTGLRKTSNGKFVNPNYYTIGIEHEGLPDDDWPEAQRAASAELIAEIGGRWQIPIDPLHVVRHHDIFRSKPCPGAKAPMEELIRRASTGPAGIATPPPAVTAPTEVTALVNLNVRAGQPSTSAPVRRVVSAGTVLAVAGFTATGQTVADNPFWYRDAAGDYFWAGNTNRPNPTA